MQKLGSTLTTLLKIGAIGITVLVGIFLVWTATFQIPDLGNFEERKIEQSTKIYDRTGETLLFNFHDEVRRTAIPFDEISQTIKDATVAIEDDEFYNHNGVDLSAIIRAVLINVKNGNVLGGQGGSTITQQVIKNSLLTTEKTLTRKVKEWVLAMRLERKLDKDKILEIYLNEVPYGGNVYGVEEAAQRFFAKPASDLTIAESAYLAALPQAPTYYSPYGPNTERLEARKNLVLKNMMGEGFISRAEYEAALSEEVDFVPQEETNIKAPHFVFFVHDYLVERYGEQAVERGLTVVTTLDYELQEKAQEIVKRNALENEDQFNAENGSMVAIDPQTGHILMMVGSRDYFDEEIPGKFNIATAHRQPGSAFKPFVYATALNQGYTTETTVFDLQTQFSTACAPNNFSNQAPCYSPQNYDNTFRGPITFRNALAQSVNIPAVKALYLAGLDNSLQLARDLGITSLTDAARYGLTLVLGGGEVSLLDMTSAYGVFANEGVRNPPVGILKVTDSSGEVLEEYEEDDSRVLPESTALFISDILSDNTARTPAFGANSLLHFPGEDVAVKTGTTNDTRDAWIVGYTPRIAVGAWAGNNDNRPMVKQVAGFIVAPMWNEFMQEVLGEYGGNFKEPPSLPTEDLKPVLQGGVGRDSNGNPHSILYFVEKSNPRGDYPRNPASDGQFNLWEYPVSLWSGGNPFIGGGESGDVSLIGLSSTYNRRDEISFSIGGGTRFDTVRLYINGNLMEERDSEPFLFTLDAQELGEGSHTIEAEVLEENTPVGQTGRTIRIR